MKLQVILAFFCALILLSGCRSHSSLPLVESEGVERATGYWYLSDNGQRQWRSFKIEPNSDGNISTEITTDISPFGNGKG